MTILAAILLSIVEGITEFLPVSSTGHLILATKTLGITPTAFTTSFELFIQLGAILAVVFLYWKKILSAPAYIGKLFVSFIPTAIAGFALYPIIKNMLLGNAMVVSWSLIIGGFFLIAVERRLLTKKTEEDVKDISYMQAFLIGCAQCLSFVPGVSRAGATIVGALLLGISRSVAVEYSFLLAVPTMAAAVGMDLLKSAWQFTSFEYMLLAFGLLGAFATALMAIKAFTTYVKNSSFIPFGIYRILVGTLFLFA